MAARAIGTIGPIALALIGVWAAWADRPGLWRVFAVAPLALILPGYTLSRALFPVVLGGLERVTFSVALQLATVGLTGCILDRVASITTRDWACVLGGLTVVFGLVPPQVRSTRFMTALTPKNIALSGLVLVSSTGAITLSYLSAVRQKSSTGFSQLWMLPDAKHSAVTIGIRSHELGETDFTVNVTLNGLDLKQFSNLRLKPGAIWEERLDIPARVNIRLIEALLLKGNDNQLYRHVSVWLNNSPDAAAPSDK